MVTNFPRKQNNKTIECEFNGSENNVDECQNIVWFLLFFLKENWKQEN